MLQTFPVMNSFADWRTTDPCWRMWNAVYYQNTVYNPKAVFTSVSQSMGTGRNLRAGLSLRTYSMVLYRGSRIRMKNVSSYYYNGKPGLW